MTAIAIKGAKAGQDKTRKPSIAKDSVASTSTAKLLYGLAEGEVWGLVDGGKSIRLDGTPLLDDAGNSNFEGVTWDFRHGTNEQEYIKGFPDVSNETPINVELRSDNPWIKAFTDTQLSAVRVRFKWNRLSKTNPDNGDVTGYKIDYAIDLQTDGGVYQNVLTTKIEDKTSAGYERTHRIDLPRSTTGWQIRVRRLTANDPSEYVQDDMLIDAVAEVVDVKLRYPNTALLGLQYNAETFSSIAKLEAHVRGAIVRVPSNYDAVARTYTGIWDGTFKDAYSNNPVWAYFYLCTQWRGGLGERLDITMIDKWSLYALGQYCDQKVSDGQGGLEPRFTCNVYLQKQVDSYQVLQNLGGIFRAMSYWNGERIVLDADVPQDPVYTFSRANVIDGNFEYTGTRARDRHTLAKVAWDNPLNRFETEYEYIRDEKAMAKFGVKVLDLSAFGCTSQAQAQRAGLWALKTEQLETRQVSFGVGLDGFIPQVGNIINVSDELFAGRANGGRVSAVSDAQYVVTLDRDVVANAGDVLIVNGGGGQSERRTIKSVSGRKITLNVAFTAVEAENVWAIETADLKLMRFRVMSITKSDETTFAITAIQHEPQKYDAIDFGADVKPTDITIVNPDVVDAPASVTITSRHRVVQGQTIATLVIGWAQVKDAVAYDVEWRKDDGSWIKVPRTGNVSVEIEGVYSGNYLARVRSVSAFDVQSQPTTSQLTTVQGKIGLPPTIVGLVATGVLFGMEIKWGFAAGSGDADYTEIETASAPDTNVALLGQYSYPTNTHTVTGLQGNLAQSYRARLVDKLGFKSAWSSWVTGTTDASADKVLDLIQGQIDESALDQALRSEIGKIDTNKTLLDNVSIDVSKAKADIVTAISKADAAKADAAANKVDLIAVNEAVVSNKTAVDSSITTLTNKDISLTNLYTALQSEYATNKAKVTQDLKTLSDKDISLTSLLTALDSDYKGNKASVNQSLTTLTNKDTALTNSLTSLTSTVGNNSTAIQAEVTARADAVSALAITVDTLQTTVSNNTALRHYLMRFDWNNWTNYAGAGELTTSSANGMIIGNNSGDDQQWLIRNENIPLLVGVIYRITARYRNVSGTGATYVGVAGVAANGTTLVNSSGSDTYGSQYYTGSDAAVGGWKEMTGYIAAAGTDLKGLPVNVLHGSAAYFRPLLIANYSRTAGQTYFEYFKVETVDKVSTASVEESKISIDGINAQYTIKLDVGGRVSGFGLMSSATQSDFAINADKFWIAPPTGTSKGKSPFMVLSSPQTINGTVVPAGTYMDSTFIHKAAIDTAQIRDAAIKTAQIDDLAVKSANIDNLAVTTGKIANLAVDTLKIAGNAVTIPVTSFTADSISINSDGTTVQSLYIPASMGFTSVNFNAVFLNTQKSEYQEIQCRLLFNGAEIMGWLRVFRLDGNLGQEGGIASGGTISLIRHLTVNVNGTLEVQLKTQSSLFGTLVSSRYLSSITMRK